MSKFTIEDMHQLAGERHGKCLSKEYINSQTPLRWQCAEGHEWNAAASSLRRKRGGGSWCGKCAGRGATAKLSIEEMQEMAESRGGKCLSDKYINIGTKLHWQCASGHEWKATADQLRNQSQWCPQCSSGIGERITRAFFEQLFDGKFTSCRPDWLKVESGRNLELDGYCASRKLAFEHQGMHHYEAGHYGETKSNSKKRKGHDVFKFDQIKRQRCEERGVTLIEVPELPKLLKIHDLKEHIRVECKAKCYPLPKSFDTKTVDLKPAYVGARNTLGLQNAQMLAAEHGGRCLSLAFISTHSKLKWRCSLGHEWDATLSSIEHSNSWCPHCSGRARLGISDAQQLASKFGGECLSSNYKNSRSPLRWRCAKGHEWKSSYGSALGGSWCPECKGVKRLTLQDAQQIASERGGECLSVKYKNTKTKLLWLCSLGHEWEATLDGIKNGNSWCPICAKRKS